MVAVTEVTGLLSFGIFTAGRLIELADTARRNREKCRVLKRRVENISLLLRELESQWTPDPVTGKLLKDLNDALDDGKALVQSCQERRTWSLVFRTQKKARKFDDLDDRITKIMDTFHIANMILIVKPYRNGGAAAAVACGASSSTAVDVKVVLDLAVSIVQEAKTLRRSREEIQQLVQFVEQAANGIEQLQSSNLSWDPKTKPMVDDLRELLLQARNILSHHNRPHRNNYTRMSQAFSCAGGGGGYDTLDDEPDQILQVAYKIEYYVQVLPVITIGSTRIHPNA